MITKKERRLMKPEDFALPNERKYAINTPARARFAIFLAKKHLKNNPEKLNQVFEAIRNRYGWNI